jgi:hypothetical protein
VEVLTLPASSPSATKDAVLATLNRKDNDLQEKPDAVLTGGRLTTQTHRTKSPQKIQGGVGTNQLLPVTQQKISTHKNDLGGAVHTYHRKDSISTMLASHRKDHRSTVQTSYRRPIVYVAVLQKKNNLPPTIGPSTSNLPSSPKKSIGQNNPLDSTPNTHMIVPSQQTN